MCKRQPSRPQLLALALIGFAVALTACGNTDRNAMTADNRAAATSGSTSLSDVKRPIDVTGCLQKADGSFVLTEISRPAPNAAPTEKEGDGSVVERERLYAAQHAYRLTADKDNDLRTLVGRQVRVSGTVTEKSDLTVGDERRANDLMVGTSGSQDTNHGRSKRAKTDTGDLTRVDVRSIQQVAAGCGSRTP